MYANVSSGDSVMNFDIRLQLPPLSPLGLRYNGNTVSLPLGSIEKNPSLIAVSTAQTFENSASFDCRLTTSPSVPAIKCSVDVRRGRARKPLVRPVKYVHWRSKGRTRIWIASPSPSPRSSLALAILQLGVSGSISYFLESSLTVRLRKSATTHFSESRVGWIET